MSPTPKTDLAWLTERPITHRGLHDMNKACWENTLTAFERSAAANYSIECDITMSGDGVPMVFHDHDMRRLTGRDQMIQHTTAKELGRISIGGTADRIPQLSEMLELVDGRVPLIIELKGDKGHDDGMVATVANCLKGYKGVAAIMSFDHHLVRQFSTQAPGILAGLTAEHTDEAALEAHFSMLAHDLSFVSFDVDALPNPFIAFVRDKLAMPFITWTVRDRQTAELTWREGGQITFEGFDPGAIS